MRILLSGTRGRAVLAVSVPLLMVAGRSTLAAQSVVGVVAEAETGAPLTGVLVSLESLEGHRLQWVLTDDRGRFGFRAQRGDYRLRAERIGLATAATPPFSVGSQSDPPRTILMGQSALRLSGLDVDGRVRACRIDPHSAISLQRWWSEARKALEATAVIENTSGTHFRVSEFEREWDSSMRSLLREVTEQRPSTTSKPFVSLDVESLSVGGFVQGAPGSRLFYAPDAEVLLSDAFLNEHCYSVVHSTERPTQVGLRIEPTRDRDRIDILGTMWIDTLSARLTEFEFRYANLPPDIPGEEAGGRLEFAYLPDGTWLVSEWWIRMPRVGVRRDRFRGETREVYEVTGHVDVGGVVQYGSEPTGGTQGDRRAGSITGVVTDSLAGGPLANARVVVTGTAISARTDATGAFTLDDVPAGAQGLTVFHASTSRLGIGSLVRDVEVVPGDTVSVTLATPGFRGIRTRLCPASPSEAAPTILVGRVVLDDGGVAGIVVRATWRREQAGSLRDAWVEAESDSNGRFVFCTLPEERPIDLRVQVRGRTARVEVDLAPRRVTYRELRIIPDGR